MEKWNTLTCSYTNYGDMCSSCLDLGVQNWQGFLHFLTFTILLLCFPSCAEIYLWFSFVILPHFSIPFWTEQRKRNKIVIFLHFLWQNWRIVSMKIFFRFSPLSTYKVYDLSKVLIVILKCSANGTNQFWHRMEIFDLEEAKLFFTTF